MNGNIQVFINMYGMAGINQIGAMGGKFCFLKLLVASESYALIMVGHVANVAFHDEAVQRQPTNQAAKMDMNLPYFKCTLQTYI